MRVGFACGVFDLFHAGHVLMLRECREHCDHLIVAVNRADSFSSVINPNKRPPVYTLEERTLILSSIRFVDEVVPYGSEEELLEILGSRSIAVRFLGEDYRGRPITGESLGIPIHYTNRSHGYSTTAVVARVLAAGRLVTRENG